MRENGFPLEDGVNCASVELLNLDHARGVLAAYGRAKGALPSHAGDQTNEHIQFFDRAIAGLAEDGVVSPMRLTMFAETIKNVLWTPAQLRRIGGVHGVGVAFLRAVFDSTSGRRKYRRHQQAARAVLAALCPDRDVALRETASDFQRLLEVSGYSDSPQKFEELLSILNHHLKLISLVDPEDLTGAEGDKVSDENCRFYRLSHAYLAPIVRVWTDSEKKRTLWERVKSYLTKFSTRAIRQATP